MTNKFLNEPGKDHPSRVKYNFSILEKNKSVFLPGFRSPDARRIRAAAYKFTLDHPDFIISGYTVEGGIAVWRV